MNTRAEALATLDEGQSRLVALLERLSDDEAARPATIGGGEWSALDLLGHIAYWEEIALRAALEWRAGERPWIEQVFEEKRIDEVNAENQERGRAMPAAAMRARAEEAHEALVRLVADMGDDEWAAKAPYKTARRDSLGNLLGSITGAPKRGFGHVFAHLKDLEDYILLCQSRSSA